MAGTLGSLPSQQVSAPALMGVGGTVAASTELVAMAWSQPNSLKARVGEGRLGQITYPTEQTLKLYYGDMPIICLPCVL